MRLRSILDLIAQARALSIDGEVSHTVHSYPARDPGEIHRSRSTPYEPAAIQYMERDEFHYRTADGVATMATPWREAYTDKCKRCGGIAKGERCYMSPPCS